MAILESIASRGYRATEAQVEQLAKHVALGRRADGTYLRVLCAAVKAKRPRSRAQALAVLDLLHERFYKAVQRGVGPATLKASERRRRSAFARSTASTLRGFIRGGGSVRKIDVATVSKLQLRRASMPTLRGSRDDRIAQASQRSLLSAVRRMARKRPEHARDKLNAVIAACTRELRALPATQDTGVKGQAHDFVNRKPAVSPAVTGNGHAAAA